MATIDFYWDIGSTNTYPTPVGGPSRCTSSARSRSSTVHPSRCTRSISGSCSGTTTTSFKDEPAAKLGNHGRDLARWAEKYALPFRVPDRFPIKTSRPLRGTLAARELGAETPYIDAIFTRYWERNDASITEVDGMQALVRVIGVDPDEFVSLCDGPAIRQALIHATQAALDRGVFGAPSFYIGDELFWGKDRMRFIDDEPTRLGRG